MRLSMTAEYAIRAMVHLSSHAAKEITHISEISIKQGIPESILRKIMGNLVKLGFVYSLRGKGGGVQLARPGNDITLLDVIEGIEGKILASKYARENNIPFLGICLGLQCAVIDFAKHVSNLKNANSTEFKNRLKFPVIDLMPKQKKIKNKGATMRLGSYSCDLKKESLAYKAYQQSSIYERHRHRYEVNDKFIKRLTKDGLIFTGNNKRLNLVEVIELKNHPWFIGVQFHPELKSRIVKVHPLFKDFIAAAIKYHEKQQ